jgi:hypothetical protein
VNIDFSTIKDFRITEGQALQFRMEMFNAPNHVEWGSPNASWGNQNAPPLPPASSFGQISIYLDKHATDPVGAEV